jgi:hypothetical protein
MRPPGGLTTDMFNYGNDINIYYEWANIILHNRFSAITSRPFHCAYIGRKWNHRYKHSHKEILHQFRAQIVANEEISGIFSAALGNFGYVVRSPVLEDVFRIANFIQEKEESA